MGLVRSIGVSSRLDESLVGELDNRAEIKVKQLQKNGTKSRAKIQESVYDSNEIMRHSLPGWNP